MSVNPGARENEVSPLPRQMVLGIVNVIRAWQMTEIYDMSGKHLPVTASFIVRWCSAAELTPLRSVRPSYRFLRPRSRENLSPAGTSHFPRPWAGHVRRLRPPDHDTSCPAWPESVDTNTEQSTYKQAGRRHSHPYNTLIIRYHLIYVWIHRLFLASNPHAFL